MESKITFSGPGPFDLPVAQSSTAGIVGSVSRTDNIVRLSFRVLVDPNRPELVRIAVPSSQALDLAEKIRTAVLGPVKDG
jgi:hypothetical protein